MARPIEAKPVLKGKDAEVFLAQMNAFSLRWLESVANESKQAGNRTRVSRPYPRTAPCAINCRADGDQISAMIGPNPMEGVCGYGDDLPAALRDLADNLEREVGEEPADAKQGCRNIL